MLEEKVQQEEARAYLDALFEKYMRDGRARRRAKDVLQKRIGEKIQPFPRRRREEKLNLLIQHRAVGAASRHAPMHRAASSRAKAMLQKLHKS